MPVNLVLSPARIIAPEPTDVISFISVTLWVERSVMSLGLFNINASPLVALQSACTLTSALSAIPVNLVFKASV